MMQIVDIKEIIENKEEFLKRIFVDLVKTGYRRDRGDVAYIPVNDTLELQFKLQIEDMIKDSRLCIFNEHLNRFGLDAIALNNIALENTKRLFPAIFKPLNELLSIPLVPDVPMYVLTNEKKSFGAATVLYSGMRQEIESVIGEFIVIPSSIHETIILPAYMSDPGIVDVIKEVNSTVVDEWDQLSDVPYRFTESGELQEIDFDR